MINYIFDNKIKVSDNSLRYNGYTWYNQSVGQLDAIEFFCGLIKNDKDFVIIDIGAQSGAYSLCSKFYSNTNWFSFEADPVNYNCLIENIALNDITNIKPYNIGLGNEEGELILNVCRNHRGLNTFGKELKRFGIEEREEVNIRVNKLDNLEEISKIDLIKIDTEGCEYDIILGAMNKIKIFKPKIFMEYHEENLNQFGYTLDDLNKLIDAIGYHITWGKEDNILIESK
jgi:FkbM family methyltransferase